MISNTITDIFNKYNCDKGTRHPEAHDYGPVYARIFNSMTAVDSLLEIGVKRGRSIAAWKDLFPQARVVGVDIVDVTTFEDGYLGLFPRCPAMDQWQFVQGDSTDPALAETIEGTFDIIIDDGSHLWEDQFKTFTAFKDKFTQIYVIEDIVGARHERFLRDQIKKLGFTNIYTYDSALEIQVEYVVGRGPEKVRVKTMAIVKDAERQLER